jgi:hypothetical protein
MQGETDRQTLVLYVQCYILEDCSYNFTKSELLYSLVSVLATGPKVRGFKPGRER